LDWIWRDAQGDAPSTEKASCEKDGQYPKKIKDANVASESYLTGIGA